MEIVRIHAPYLYAVKYDGDSLNIYRRTLSKLTDDRYLTEFFNRFGSRISDYIVQKFKIDRSETEEYAAEVKAQMLDNHEFSNCFDPHSKFDIRELPDGGGRSYKYATGYLPVKCKGSSATPLVRIYAIELSLRCYIIVYGGIKLALDTNDAPDLDKDGNTSTLERELKSRLLTVCGFLAQNGIISPDGLTEYVEERQ